MSKSIIAQRLRLAREREKLSQVDVYNKTGINNKTLSGYENDVSDPDLETLKTLALLYNCTTDYLLGLTDHPGVALMPRKEKVTNEELELIELARKLKNLPPEKRKAIEILAGDDEQATGLGN